MGADGAAPGSLTQDVMSQKNREGKRTARERMREERARQEVVRRRVRAFTVAGVVAGVLAVVGIVGVLLVSQDDTPSGPATEPVALGKARAPSTLTVYEDFRCPACAQFERGYAETIRELQEQGQLRTEYHLVTIIDGNLGGSGSKNAANAALCARDQGRFAEYHDVLFAHQPQERDDAFGDKDRLVELAGKVDGLDGAAFRDCVRQGTHDARVERSDAAFGDSGYQATPTVLLDGENIYTAERQLTPEMLRERVTEAAARP